MELKINPEFQKLIPALKPEELQQLEANILADGCLDALVVWNDVIVDGHNRYAICRKHKLPFKTINKEFESEAHVRIWMRNLALGQRNLEDAWKIELALENKKDLAAVGAAKRKATEGRPSEQKTVVHLDNSLPPAKHNTRVELAKAADVSPGTIARAERVRAAAPELWEQAKAGEITVGGAYKQLVKEEKAAKRRAEIEAQRKALEESPPEAPPTDFDVVVIDPPWPYGREYDPEGSRVANPYPEMSLEQIAAINIPAKDDAVMFLWTTHQFLAPSFKLLLDWGFQYKATLVWDKDKIGMGAWLRMQCEFCLVGIRGKPTWDNTKHRDIIREARREHSRKPEAFYAMVEAITVGTRIDYFSRAERLNWYSYGNDTRKF